MSTITVSDIPLRADTAAERLRRTAAAVRVHFTWWGVRRALTTAQKEEIGAACNADARLLTAGKKLVDVRHEAFRRLTALRGRIISYWRGISLPYVEPGVRLIRQADIDNFRQVLEAFRGELSDAEEDLNAVYDQIKADARRRLGRLYNPGDYPTEVRGLFAVDYDFPSIEPPSYLMRLNPQIYQEEQTRIAQRFEEAVRLAEQAFVGELARLVSHLTERLATGADGQRKVFRDSAVENLADFFEQFRRLNIGSSAQLDQLVERAQQVVRGIEPQALRDNSALRQQVATQLSQVQATLDGLMVDQPRRRLLRNPTIGGGANGTAG